VWNGSRGGRRRVAVPYTSLQKTSSSRHAASLGLRHAQSFPGPCRTCPARPGQRGGAMVRLHGLGLQPHRALHLSGRDGAVRGLLARDRCASGDRGLRPAAHRGGKTLRGVAGLRGRVRPRQRALRGLHAVFLRPRPLRGDRCPLELGRTRGSQMSLRRCSIGDILWNMPKEAGSTRPATGQAIKAIQPRGRHPRFSGRDHK
jgi:hypothetical protein